MTPPIEKDPETGERPAPRVMLGEWLVSPAVFMFIGILGVIGALFFPHAGNSVAQYPVWAALGQGSSIIAAGAFVAAAISKSRGL